MLLMPCEVLAYDTHAYLKLFIDDRARNLDKTSPNISSSVLDPNVSYGCVSFSVSSLGNKPILKPPSISNTRSSRRSSSLSISAGLSLETRASCYVNRFFSF